MYLFLFFKSFITFTSMHVFKMAHLYKILQLSKLLLYTLYTRYTCIYIFFHKRIQDRKKILFWSILRFNTNLFGFFYLKEQINLQHQSYGNCFKSADTRPIIQSLHTTVEFISCTSKLNACAPKYIIKIEQWKNCGVWWHKAI